MKYADNITKVCGAGLTPLRWNDSMAHNSLSLGWGMWEIGCILLAPVFTFPRVPHCCGCSTRVPRIRARDTATPLTVSPLLAGGGIGQNPPPSAPTTTHMHTCTLEEFSSVGETVILLHPPLHLVGVSVVMERGRQQLLRFSAAKGVFELGWRHHHGHPRALPLRLFADVGVHARHLSCSGCVHGLFHGQRCASTKILRLSTESTSPQIHGLPNGF